VLNYLIIYRFNEQLAFSY